MYGKMFSACLYGIEGVMIGVEIDLANGLPQTNIIGNIVRTINDKIYWCLYKFIFITCLIQKHFFFF
ncbi:hypothetical protein BSK50_11890 [Paenibacillus odorifer]|nr:hypothetical protein BSK50_11890 [Paenibacillus odorifer]